MVEYRFLGPVEAVRDGQAVALASGKQSALLAALLMERNEAVSAERLIERLWGDRPPATVQKNLQIVVSQLRKVLGEDAIRTAAGGLHAGGGGGRSGRGAVRAPPGGRS